VTAVRRRGDEPDPVAPLERARALRVTALEAERLAEEATAKGAPVAAREWYDVAWSALRVARAYELEDPSRRG
jgi:hypothetical protein